MASDHADSPALGEGADALDAGADINDLYAFASPTEPTKTVGILTVGGIGAATGAFSDAVSYSVIYVPVIGTDVVPIAPLGVNCAFAGDPQGFSCWVGDAGGDGPAVRGAVGTTATSADGSLKVWAGLSDDPFFFDLPGFNATVAAYAPAFTDPPTDALAGANTLAIVFEVTADTVNATVGDADADNDTTVLGAFGLTKRLPADDGGGDNGDM
jgi:hypothetical protein